MKIESKRDVVICLADMLTRIADDACEGAEIDWKSDAEQIIDLVIEYAPLLVTGEMEVLK